jgi:molecular chaperone GrpE (heat shock protein)
MKKWISDQFEKGQPGEEPEQDMQYMQKELQEARLELVAHQQAVERLTRENEAMRLRQNDLLRDTVSAELESLLRDAAAPAAQLATQAYLVENQSRVLQARDVLVVAKRLLRALEKHGLQLVSAPGDVELFDPDWHLPLNANQPLDPGQEIVIRFPAVTYQGKVIARAGVEPRKEGE